MAILRMRNKNTNAIVRDMSVKTSTNVNDGKDYLCMYGKNILLTSDITNSKENPRLRIRHKTNGTTLYVNELITPQVDGAIIYPTAELANHLTTFKPPTFEEIFNTWGRFGSGTYYPPGTPAQGEATAWIYNGSVVCTQNTGTTTGFVSNDKYTTYTHEVIVSSTDGDNDQISAVVAFKSMGESLLLSLHDGGLPGNSFAFILGADGAFGSSNQITGMNIPVNNGWRGRAAKLKITRNDRIIVAQTTGILGSVAEAINTPFNSAYTLTIDAATIPSLSWLSGPLAYGYSALSQNASTFSNVVFDSPDNLKNVAYDSTTGAVWKYTTSWQNTGRTIQQELGYPRVITSSTGIAYKILKNSIIRI